MTPAYTSSNTKKDSTIWIYPWLYLGSEVSTNCACSTRSPPRITISNSCFPVDIAVKGSLRVRDNGLISIVDDVVHRSNERCPWPRSLPH